MKNLKTHHQQSLAKPSGIRLRPPRTPLAFLSTSSFPGSEGLLPAAAGAETPPGASEGAYNMHKCAGLSLTRLGAGSGDSRPHTQAGVGQTSCPAPGGTRAGLHLDIEDTNVTTPEETHSFHGDNGDPDIDGDPADLAAVHADGAGKSGGGRGAEGQAAGAELGEIPGSNGVCVVGDQGWDRPHPRTPTSCAPMRKSEREEG